MLLVASDVENGRIYETKTGRRCKQAGGSSKQHVIGEQQKMEASVVTDAVFRSSNRRTSGMMKRKWPTPSQSVVKKRLVHCVNSLCTLGARVDSIPLDALRRWSTVQGGHFAMGSGLLGGRNGCWIWNPLTLLASEQTHMRLHPESCQTERNFASE